MSDPAWLDRQLAGAPPELVDRTRAFVAGGGGGVSAAHLARASQMALEQAIVARADRTAALNLLAADALVTLALAARVEEDPGQLEAFARSIRRGVGGSA